MKKNDVIAIIIIILFIILAGVSFGIWKLVSMAKNHMKKHRLPGPHSVDLFKAFKAFFSIPLQAQKALGCLTFLFILLWAQRFRDDDYMSLFCFLFFGHNIKNHGGMWIGNVWTVGLVSDWI
ncbi:hypothetical protein NXS19_005552 [Fusarium pseudograminearum]|nr:hypothetical protein NXS19_005552 [Fusarium pseudograminearum]